MKIALFSDCYMPSKNGVVTVIMQLAEHLKKAGHKVILVVPETTDEYATSSKDIYRVKSFPLGFGTDQMVAVPNMHHLIHYLYNENIDIIHCHTEFGIGKAGLRTAKVLHKPCVCTTHTMWVDFYKYYLPLARLIKPGFINRLSRKFYGKFNALIGVSSKARNYYKQKNMLPDIPSVVIPNALDKSEFIHTEFSETEKQELKRTLNITENDTVLLFLGRIAEEKRVFELLQQCKKLVRNAENCKVLFVGDGPALSRMKKIAEKESADRKIIFTGFVEWAEVHKFYEISDIFITASLSEMHSITILEAEFSGLPIVARKDESYFDSVYDGKNGYLAENDSILYEKMKELVNDKAKRIEFGKKSLEMTRHFGIENFIKKTEIVYKDVIEAYPGKIDETKTAEKISRIY